MFLKEAYVMFIKTDKHVLHVFFCTDSIMNHRNNNYSSR